jgi:hypothetical protein
MTRWVWTVLGAISGIAAIVLLAGFALPERHIAKAERIVALDPAAVAARLRDVASYPKWRTGVAVSDIVTDGRVTRYTETSGGQTIHFELRETEAGRQFVSTILDKDLPFGGSWTFALGADDGGTRVVIVEAGVIRNPVFRVLAAYLVGHTAAMERYLDDLASTGQAHAGPAPAGQSLSGSRQPVSCSKGSSWPLAAPSRAA